MGALLDELIERVAGMTPDQQAAVLKETEDALRDVCWVPNEGPQMEAYFSDADELFYGGSAGGGKTDLILGLSATAHRKSLILRRFGADARSMFERCSTIIGDAANEAGDEDEGAKNKTLLTRDYKGHHIQFGGCQHEDDKQRFKGRDHDLKAFDEISDFTESQFRFIKTWNRSTVPDQRCRVVATGNPPTNAEGLWVIRYWGAWLDPTHPNPAKEGQLRYYIKDKYDVDHEVEGYGPHKITHDDGSEEILRAKSRTFIRAWLHDNPYLIKTSYAATLDALPAELRLAYRDGRFDLSLEDSPRQVIPTKWILEAQNRWRAHPKPPTGVPMCNIGVDIAQGGKDSTTLAPRYDGWFAQIIKEKGEKTKTGNEVAAMVVKTRRDRSDVTLDMGGGYGGETRLVLEQNGITPKQYKGSLESRARSKCGTYYFANKRVESHWKFREALDPDQAGGSPIFLPDSPNLVADLASLQFEVKRGSLGLTIYMTTKEDVCKMLGRSTDEGDAVVISWSEGAKSGTDWGEWQKKRKGSVVTQVNLGHNTQRRRPS